MNYFDAVDFSEFHSEEVISFFWRSVYINAVIWTYAANLWTTYSINTYIWVHTSHVSIQDNKTDI